MNDEEKDQMSSDIRQIEAPITGTDTREALLGWAARLVRAVCAPCPDEIGEPVRHVAMEMRRAFDAARPALAALQPPPIGETPMLSGEARFMADHSVALEFVREISQLECQAGEGCICLSCRAQAWLHTPDGDRLRRGSDDHKENAPGHLVVDLRYGSRHHHLEGEMGLHPERVETILRAVHEALDQPAPSPAVPLASVHGETPSRPFSAEDFDDRATILGHANGHSRTCAMLRSGAALRREVERLTAEHWTCFHCGEIFTTRGGASDHFGETREAVAGCLIDRVAIEKGGTPERGRGLLMALRTAEREVARLTHELSESRSAPRLLSAR